MSIKTLYLAAYNIVQAAGWSICLYQLGKQWQQQPHSYDQVYSAGVPMAREVPHVDEPSSSIIPGLFQATSLLETVHAAIGLVPSNPALGFIQWAARSNVLYLVLGAIPEVQATLPAIILLAVWALSEVIRYPWYALTTLNACPAALTWLRYTAFIPLYPIGVACEMYLLWKALPTLEAKHMYSLDMPNKINFGFQYHTFVKVGLFVYVPIWWNLYWSLLRQRQKKLGPGPSKTKTQ